MIEIVTTPNAVLNAAISAGMLLFGAWVLTLTPRTRSTLLLAAFAIAAGAIHVPGNLTAWSGWEAYAIFLPYQSLMATVGAVALFGLARELARPSGPRGRRVWVAATAAAAVLAVLPVAVLGARGGLGAGELTGLQFLSLNAALLAGDLFFLGFLATGIVLVWIHRHPPVGRVEGARLPVALISAGLGLWPAFQAGANATALASPPVGPVQLAAVAAPLAAWLVLAGVWLANASALPAGDDRAARNARNVALVILGAMFLGMLNRFYAEPFFAPADDPFFDLVRLLTVVVLGYAILRHEAFGVDAQFRWGVSKTTVAGVFIAVFFIVSEGAQVLFAGFAGSELLGIIAAGALLFALSPIQKLADRIAEKAVPSTPDGAPGTAAGPTPRAEAAYKETLRKFLSDDALSRDEEKALADLARELGLDPGRAFELREEVEDEMAEMAETASDGDGA